MRQMPNVRCRVMGRSSRANLSRSNTRQIAPNHSYTKSMAFSKFVHTRVCVVCVCHVCVCVCVCVCVHVMPNECFVFQPREGRRAQYPVHASPSPSSAPTRGISSSTAVGYINSNCEHVDTPGPGPTIVCNATRFVKNKKHPVPFGFVHNADIECRQKITRGMKKKVQMKR